MIFKNCFKRISRNEAPDIRLRYSLNENPRRLYDTTLPDKSGFSSFSRITDDPEKTILRSG
jgi:hypothetical protein